MGVAVGADHAEHAVGYFEHRDVKRAAAEVEHHDRFLRLLVEAVGERRRCGLVDDPHHLQARDLTGILGGLPLGVVEIGRDGDHRLVDLVAEIGLGRLLQRPEHLGGDLRRGELLVTGADLDVILRATDDLVRHHLLLAADLVVPPPHEPFDGVDGSLGIGDGLSAGDVAHERLALVVEGHHTRREAVALLVRDHLGLLALHHGDDGVGGAQIDADDLLALLGGHDRGPLVGVRSWAGGSAVGRRPSHFWPSDHATSRNAKAVPRLGMPGYRSRGPGKIPRFVVFTPAQPWVQWWASPARPTAGSCGSAILAVAGSRTAPGLQWLTLAHRGIRQRTGPASRASHLSGRRSTNSTDSSSA